MSNLKPIVEAVVEGDAKKVEELTRMTIADGVSAATILDAGLIAGMEAIGELFSRREAFVPELLSAARAMQAGIKLIEPLLIDSGVKPIGRVALGTVKGDIHNIGKDLVGIMLKGAGFEVIDLGVDVPPEKFVDAVRDGGVDIVGMSALLTSSMPVMKTTIEALQAAGLRERIKIMVGGAVVTKDYADSIGADGYGADAAEAVNKAKELLSLKGGRR